LTSTIIELISLVIDELEDYAFLSSILSNQSGSRAKVRLKQLLRVIFRMAFLKNKLFIICELIIEFLWAIDSN